jgi:predicted XRE-type DNA-binding protein
MSPDESIHALRRQLAREIVRALGPNSQYVIAPAYGIPQPRMSELAKGKVDRCTVEWLIRRIHRMGGRVTIVVALDDTARAWHLAHSKSGIQGRRPSTG